MEMQSASAKSAQPVFTGDLAKMAFTVVSAIALVIGLTVALVIVRSPSATLPSTSGVEQALVQIRADERAAFVAPRDALKVEQALIQHRADERLPLGLRSPAAIQAETDRWEALAASYGAGTVTGGGPHKFAN
ncbi:MAG TPA: hypothetical protein VH813_08935 [Candidatus Limnocylindrales bacterium]|jgi:hypothetical protein